MTLPAAQVERALVDHPPGWLAEMAGAAQQRGDELLTEVGVGPLGDQAGAAGRHPTRRAGAVPLDDVADPDLGADRAGGTAPRLDADIELGSLGEDRTQLAISARYRPPLRVVGRAEDRVLLHRVAEATVKDFLDRLGQAIFGQTGGAETTRT